jgi:hypothetical protein
VKTLSEYTYFSFCPKSCGTICRGIIFPCRHSSPASPAAALAAPQRLSVSAAGATALVVPGRPPPCMRRGFSNGKDIERKANESFDNGFFFDIEAKRTRLIVYGFPQAFLYWKRPLQQNEKGRKRNEKEDCTCGGQTVARPRPLPPPPIKMR